MNYEQVDLIEVWAWGQLVGAVAPDPGTGVYAFEYDDDWIARGVELSPLRMPGKPGTYEFPELSERTYRHLPGMLADSLPDRFGNELVTAKLAEAGIAAEAITSLDRLAYAGDRAMGALEFRPPAERAGRHTTALQLADLVVAARSAVDRRFDGDDETHEALQQLIQVGTSAGGIRPKAVVCFNPETGQVRSGQFEAPPGYEHWLIKLDGVDELGSLGVEGSPSSAYGRIEYAYSLMARDCGIDMMPCRLLLENERAHFMTQRFDRSGNGPKIHTQTLCAIDHLDFNMLDAHSYAQYLEVIDRLGLGPEAREQAFRRIVFNVAAVNRDDHTKNVSFCCNDSGTWSLAPAYDVTHAFNPNGPWTQRHQMSVNGKFEGITRIDLLELADRFAVPSATRALREVLNSVEHWREFAEHAGVPPHPSELVAKDMAAFRPG